jgi:hypothetical protein
MQSPPRPVLSRTRARDATLVVSNSKARDFTYYLTQAEALLRAHGAVKLSGVGAATQHALVVSEVLEARGRARVKHVETSTLRVDVEADDEDAWEHGAKVEVVLVSK